MHITSAKHGISLIWPGSIGPEVKGEVQSRITIISKERVKISLQIVCKNYENRIRNKEVVTF